MTLLQMQSLLKKLLKRSNFSAGHLAKQVVLPKENIFKVKQPFFIPYSYFTTLQVESWNHVKKRTC